jgi:hypothetical protein
MSNKKEPVEPVKSQEVEVVESTSELEIWKPGRAPISLLVCSRCYLGARCPLYNVDSESCELQEINQSDVYSPDGISKLLHDLLAIQSRRVMRLVGHEEVEGGIVDPLVTTEIERLVGLMERMKRLSEDSDEIIIKAKGKGGTSFMKEFLGGIGDK